MNTYTVNEGDGGVDLTLLLTRPIPLNFTDNTLQLEILDIDNDTPSKLCSMCVYVRAHVHACMCVYVCEVHSFKSLCCTCCNSGRDFGLM